MKIVIGASSFAAVSREALAFLHDHGCQVVKNPYGRKLNEDEIIDLLQGADGLLAGLEPLNRRVLEASRKRLKAVARIGVGLSNVDLAAAEEMGIKVSNTPDGPTTGVAEMTIAALLAICRRLVPADRAMHSHLWVKEMGRSLSGLSVLIIGYGRIGQAVAERLKAFGAEILVYDPIGASGLSAASLADVLPKAEVITLHASGEDLILGPREFKQMRRGAVLLNSARAGLVDETALVDALGSGLLAACWLDVFSREPYDGPLCDCENALLTPHLATYTEQCRLQMELQAVKNLLRDLNVI